MGFEVDCYEAALSVTLHLGAEAALSLAFPDPVESLPPLVVGGCTCVLSSRLRSLAEIFLLMFGAKVPAWYNDGKHSVSIGGTNGGSVLVQRDMLFYHHR